MVAEGGAVLVDGAVTGGGADAENLFLLAVIVGLIQTQSLGSVLLQGLDVLQGLGGGDDDGVASDSDLCHSVIHPFVRALPIKYVLRSPELSLCPP